MNTRLRNYPGAQGKLGLWRRELWRMAATACVKLLANDAVKPTREGRNPLGLPMGGCQSCSACIFTN